MGKLIGQNGRDLENDLAAGGAYELVLTTTGTSGAATYNAATDTLNIPIYGGGGTTYTVDNGLTASTATNFQLGGPLAAQATGLHNTYINWANFMFTNTWNTLSASGLKLTSTSTAAAGNAQRLVDINLSGANVTDGQTTYGLSATNSHTHTTSGQNRGVYGLASGNSTNYGIYGEITAGTGAGVVGVSSTNNSFAVEGYSTGSASIAGNFNSAGLNGTAIQGYSENLGLYAQGKVLGAKIYTEHANANTVQPILELTRSSNMSAGVGVGGSIDFRNPVNGGTIITSQISSIMTTVTAPAQSRLVLSGVNGVGLEELLTLKGDGQLRLHKYLLTTSFPGTPVGHLAFDATGNVLTVAVPTGGTGTAVTADNGLTKTLDNIQLGGTLVKATEINAGSLYTLSILGSITNEGVFKIANSSSTGKGIQTTTVDGLALDASSSGGVAIGATSLFAEAIRSTRSTGATGAVVTNMMLYTQSTGVPINGTGGSLDFQIKNDTTARLSNQIISKWTNVVDANRTSQLILTGVDLGTNQDLFTLSGDGSLKLNKYGTNTFTGTAAYNLAVDSVGNVIHVAAGGGGSTTVTANNGLTKTLDNIQLGGTLLQNTTINAGTLYDLNITGSRATTPGILQVNNTGNGRAISAFSVNDNAVDAFSTNASAIGASSTNGVAVSANSINNYAGQFTVNPSSTNNVQSALIISRGTSGTATNGIGVAIDMTNQTVSGGGKISTTLISKWLLADHTSFLKSNFIIQGVNDAIGNRQDIFTIDGAGFTRLNKYGLGTFTGTAAYNLSVDTSGNIIETALGGGGSTTTTTSAGYPCLNDITYANLVTAITNSTLVVGCYYRITDFQTVHTINTINGEAAATHTGTINPIVIRAVAVNKLAEFGDCGLYKGDTVYYKTANTTYMPGSTKGYIYRRIDHSLNISLPLDWKEVRYRRYALAIPNAWAVGTAYVKGDLVHHNAGQIYQALRASTGVTPDTVGSNAHNDYDWVYLGASNGQHLANASQFGGAKLGGTIVTVNLAAFTDYPIFDATGFGLGTYANIYMEDQANTFSDQFYFGDNIYKAFNNVFVEFCFFHNVRMDSYTKFAGNTFKGIDHTYNGASKFFHSSLSSHSSVTDNYCFNVDMYDLSLEGESTINNCTLNGLKIGNSSVSHQSGINGLTSTQGASIDYCTLMGRSFLGGHIAGGLESLLLNNSNVADTYYTFVYYSTFNYSRVHNWSHVNNKGFTFRYNTFEAVFFNGTVATEFGPIMRAANYPKEILRRPDGTHRLRYMDNADATIVTVLTA